MVLWEPPLGAHHLAQGLPILPSGQQSCDEGVWCRREAKPGARQAALRARSEGECTSCAGGRADAQTPGLLQATLCWRSSVLQAFPVPVSARALVSRALGPLS